MTALPEITARPETTVDAGTIMTIDGRTGIETVLIESGTTMIEVALAGQGVEVALPATATCIADRTVGISKAEAGHHPWTDNAPPTTRSVEDADICVEEPVIGVKEPGKGVKDIRQLLILVRELGISTINMMPIRMRAITVEWRLLRHVGIRFLLTLDGAIGRLYHPPPLTTVMPQAEAGPEQDHLVPLAFRCRANPKAPGAASTTGGLGNGSFDTTANVTSAPWISAKAGVSRERHHDSKTFTMITKSLVIIKTWICEGS